MDAARWHRWISHLQPFPQWIRDERGKGSSLLRIMWSCYWLIFDNANFLMHHNVGVTHGAWTQGRIRPNGAKMKISVTRSLMARICGLPAIGEKTVARSIFDLRQANNSLVSTPRKPCFVVPQVLISPEESSPEEVSKQKVDGFDPMSFHTLRFRKCEGKSLSYTGKCLVDVRGYVRKAVTNPHKISHSQCLGNAFPEFFSSLLKVHHYSGSFETFATHRGNSVEEVSEVHTTLWRMYLTRQMYK